MSVEQIIKMLEEESEILESYVLVRELKLFLDVGHENYHPSIDVKIHINSANKNEPFHFSVSHHVRTPSQAAPYTTSRTHAETEIAAIRRAISTTTSYLKIAIREGHEPQDEWLVPNPSF